MARKAVRKKAPGASRTPRPTPARRARAREIVARLRELYPEADCELVHRDPWQLLVATILSAQATDRSVNRVTPELFRRWPTPAALAAAEPADVEPVISSIGLYRNKAKAIVGAAREIVARFAGEVPRRREDLVTLPGVGRKTANVVLASAFHEPAIPVDTHVARLSRLLDLSRERDPVKIERDLAALLPEEDWSFASHALIWHGRRVCSARKPRCGQCALLDLCPSART